MSQEPLEEAVIIESEIVETKCYIPNVLYNAGIWIFDSHSYFFYEIDHDQATQTREIVVPVNFQTMNLALIGINMLGDEAKLIDYAFFNYGDENLYRNYFNFTTTPQNTPSASSSV